MQRAHQPCAEKHGQAPARAHVLLAEAERRQHSSAMLRCSCTGAGNTQDVRSEWPRSKVMNESNTYGRAQSQGHEQVDAPSLETFKVRSEGALSNLIWLKMSLLMAGGLD